jgi:hypothetical protein
MAGEAAFEAAMTLADGTPSPLCRKRDVAQVSSLTPPPPGPKMKLTWNCEPSGMHAQTPESGKPFSSGFWNIAMAVDGGVHESGSCVAANGQQDANDSAEHPSEQSPAVNTDAAAAAPIDSVAEAAGQQDANSIAAELPFDNGPVVNAEAASVDLKMDAVAESDAPHPAPGDEIPAEVAAAELPLPLPDSQTDEKNASSAVAPMMERSALATVAESQPDATMDGKDCESLPVGSGSSGAMASVVMDSQCISAPLADAAPYISEQECHSLEDDLPAYEWSAIEGENLDELANVLSGKVLVWLKPILVECFMGDATSSVAPRLETLRPIRDLLQMGPIPTKDYIMSILATQADPDTLPSTSPKLGCGTWSLGGRLEVRADGVFIISLREFRRLRSPAAMLGSWSFNLQDPKAAWLPVAYTLALRGIVKLMRQPSIHVPPELVKRMLPIIKSELKSIAAAAPASLSSDGPGGADEIGK